MYMLKYLTFLLVANKSCSVSPGTYTIRHMRRKDRKMQRKRLRVGQPDVKRRRLELKAERQSKNASQSVLEGTCFFIGMLQD